MVVLTVFIDGNLRDVNEFSVEEGKKGVMSITIPYATTVSTDDSFEVKTDGTTWIKGVVRRIRRTRARKSKGKGEKKILTCYGKTHTLYEKFCVDDGFHEYSDKDIGWIAKDLVDHYFAGILTSANIDTTTDVTASNFDCDAHSVGDALEDLARRGNCYFYVDNGDDVHFFVRGTVSSGLKAEDLAEIKILDETSRKFVKIIVRGKNRSIQASSGSGYPERFYQNNRITTVAEAQEVADALLAELGAARQQVEARKDSFMETRAGKTIILNRPDDGFDNEVLEIQRIRWACKPPHRHKTWFTVGDPEPTIESILAGLLKGVNYEAEVQDDLGYVDIGLPIYDPTGYVDDRGEEGYNDFKVGPTFKEPGYAKSIYRLTEIAVVAKFLAEGGASGELEIKVEYSFNAGVDWDPFGTIISVTSSEWAEYTREDNVIGDISQQMWIRFSYRVGQEGEGSVHGYMKECELRTRYKNTRWEPV